MKVTKQLQIQYGSLILTVIDRQESLKQYIQSQIPDYEAIRLKQMDLIHKKGYKRQSTINRKVTEITDIQMKHYQKWLSEIGRVIINIDALYDLYSRIINDQPTEGYSLLDIFSPMRIFQTPQIVNIRQSISYLTPWHIDTQTIQRVKREILLEELIN